MLSKSQINFVKSLHKKRVRKKERLFIVEGTKSVNEFIDSSYTISTVFYTAKDALKLSIFSQNVKLIEIKEEELSKISTLTTPQQLLALIEIPNNKTIKLPKNTLTLVLDNVQDPGNLGTIIRTADWFGFKQIVCSLDTVDVYNTKVVQASMGSLSRIQVIYTDLPALLKDYNFPIYGALLEGQSISKINFSNTGVLILGNEGNGIRDEIRHYVSHPITIPRYGEAESLNVAAATAIFCMQIRKAFN